MSPTRRRRRRNTWDTTGLIDAETLALRDDQPAPRDVFPEPIVDDPPETDEHRAARLARSAEIRAGVRAFLASHQSLTS